MKDIFGFASFVIKSGIIMLPGFVAIYTGNFWWLLGLFITLPIGVKYIEIK